MQHRTKSFSTTARSILSQQKEPMWENIYRFGWGHWEKNWEWKNVRNIDIKGMLPPTRLCHTNPPISFFCIISSLLTSVPLLFSRFSHLPFYIWLLFLLLLLCSFLCPSTIVIFLSHWSPSVSLHRHCFTELFVLSPFLFILHYFPSWVLYTVCSRMKDEFPRENNFWNGVIETLALSSNYKNINGRNNQNFTLHILTACHDLQ